MTVARGPSSRGSALVGERVLLGHGLVLSRAIFRREPGVVVGRSRAGMPGSRPRIPDAASPNRSRHGTRPISSRNRTDLDERGQRGEHHRRPQWERGPNRARPARPITRRPSPAARQGSPPPTPRAADRRSGARSRRHRARRRTTLGDSARRAPRSDHRLRGARRAENRPAHARRDRHRRSRS